MFGAALSPTVFALIEPQPSVSSPFLMRGPGHGRAHNQALVRAVNRLVAVIPAAIVLIVAVSMGIGAALLGYPVWAIPLIAILGAGGAIVAIRVFG
jgi:hypothetical protein